MNINKFSAGGSVKLDRLSFRELDRKWIAIDRKKDIKKINKLLKEDFSYEPILGYIYIDHENGINIRIVGHVTKEKNQYYLENNIIEENLIIDYDEKINFEITFLPEEASHNIKGCDKVEEDIKKFYENEPIVTSREENILDNFRHEYFPDDVEASLVTEDDEEYLWCRLEAYSPKHQVAVCTLISSSIYDDNYKEGVQVFAKIETEEKENILKIDKLAKKES